jgi:hypothetical protein
MGTALSGSQERRDVSLAYVPSFGYFVQTFNKHNTRDCELQTKPLRIKLRSTVELKPHPANAKLHPDHQLAQIAASIREYGFNDPIAVDEDSVIIEGHGRWQAASGAEAIHEETGLAYSELKTKRLEE